MQRVLILLAILLISITGCKESKNILFCEGVNANGEEVNCGTKFETGDLTAVIKSDNPFENSKIDLIIYEISGKVGGNKEIKLESQTVDVKPDENKATATLSFYNEGKYKIKAKNKGKVFADGDIEIVDY